MAQKEIITFTTKIFTLPEDANFAFSPSDPVSIEIDETDFPTKSGKKKVEWINFHLNDILEPPPASPTPVNKLEGTRLNLRNFDLSSLKVKTSNGGGGSGGGGPEIPGEDPDIPTAPTAAEITASKNKANAAISSGDKTQLQAAKTELETLKSRLEAAGESATEISTLIQSVNTKIQELEGDTAYRQRVISEITAKLTANGISETDLDDASKTKLAALKAGQTSGAEINQAADFIKQAADTAMATLNSLITKLQNSLKNDPTIPSGGTDSSPSDSFFRLDNPVL
ncbi:12553_t:CDS:2 [Funneliformis geosporum]|uniref:12553_t:CDS:1 n=1 Tax=Funneliformis geosporum TaxID=1117311 RepID=A0A9W4T635_9GLOM|nr:12553_t:CDS:2 [Funneliformis geosporum]